MPSRLIEPRPRSAGEQPAVGPEAVAADMQCGFGGTFARDSDRSVGDAATTKNPEGDRDRRLHTSVRSEGV
jgi:hypothetical protein